MDTSSPKMEARTMEADAATAEAPRITPVRQRPAVPGAADPFRLGFRVGAVATPDGRSVLGQVPLTRQDLVYPQEGDVVSDGFPHNWFLHPMADAIRRHLGKRPALLVTCSTVLVLGDGKNAGPDVAVIRGDVELSGIRRAVHLEAVGGKLVFALEAVSTSAREIRDKDLEDNVERYAEEGVEEYLTVVPVVERKVKDLVLRRLSAEGEYEEVAPDEHGRVYSEQLDLYFSVDPESEELVAVDARTGQRLLSSEEEEARADREAEARQKAEARAEHEAEARQKEAEARQKEAEARQKAEARAEHEAEARQKEAEARQKAEARAEHEAEARQKAETHAEQGLRRKVEDLCGLLGIEWTVERDSAVAGMDSAQLEALWTDLLSRKRWP